MKPELPHLSERDLLLTADGELPARRRLEAVAHLEACWSCRERMLSLESMLADLVRGRNRVLDQQLPSSACPRALLRARLAEAAASSARSTFAGVLYPVTSLGRLAAGGAVSLAVLLSILAFGSTVSAGGRKPREALTPGATRPITLAEVCQYDRAEVISRDIPEDKRQQVFAMYGIRSPKAGQFEVDYLITPDLGGTESIRNLWPQPYSTRWNAHVKDKLEERLHELVCSRRLDLATAQHDIATDWIGAYKKYVGENEPQ